MIFIVSIIRNIGE
ncbi:hypothetical protein VCHENC02_4622, partial [Vibrio harveyi]